MSRGQSRFEIFGNTSVGKWSPVTTPLDLNGQFHTLDVMIMIRNCSGQGVLCDYRIIGTMGRSFNHVVLRNKEEIHVNCDANKRTDCGQTDSKHLIDDVF